MSAQLREDVLRRLLLSKHFLESNRGQLRPESDAVAVARMILTAHDAAELAAAAIADHVGVADLTAKTYLMDYPARIRAVCPTVDPFPGVPFLRQLNDARVSFKHHGNLPDARIWYRVIDNAWDWISEWCVTYLELSLDDINLQNLVADPSVRERYVRAQEARDRGDFRGALEHLALAVYATLEWFPGIGRPILGSKNSDHALILAPFGVRPSDFLNLQEFLPHVAKRWDTEEMSLRWDSRSTGHSGNWTDRSVDFCLQTALDLILKIQHAPRPPRPVEYELVFDDVIVPNGESVEIWQYEYPEAHNPFDILTRKPSGRKTIKILEKGQLLRCRVAPAKAEDKEAAGELPIFLSIQPTMDNAEVLRLTSDELPGRIGFVERDKVAVSFLPKEDDFVREYFPHLFRQEGQQQE